jgi:hypothetical protein
MLQKSPEQVRKKLAGFGGNKIQIFESWLDRFGTSLD